MSIKALFSHKDIFTRGGFPIFNYLKFFLKKVVRTFIKTGRGGGQRPFINFIKKQTFWSRVWSLTSDGFPGGEAGHHRKARLARARDFPRQHGGQSLARAHPRTTWREKRLWGRFLFWRSSQWCFWLDLGHCFRTIFLWPARGFSHVKCFQGQT